MNPIIDYYTAYGEREWSRLDREPLEFLVNYHYIIKYLQPDSYILDNGAGPGKYAMALANLGHRLTLTDLTPKLVAIAKAKADECKLKGSFEGFHVADARNLTLFKEETFDASLMLGPMYHLQEEEGRNMAVKELHRVTKKFGYVFVAFRSRTNHTINSLMTPHRWQPNDKMDAINEFLDTGVYNHSDKGRFTGAYFYNIEDIKPFMEGHGFETIELIGSTNMGAILTEEQWNYWKQDKEEYKKLMDLLIKSASDPALLGLSSHLLYIGRKK